MAARRPGRQRMWGTHLSACVSVIIICVVGTSAKPASERSKPCNADFAGWSYCSTGGMQMRNNINCPELFEARECFTSDVCQPFTAWDPPTDKCKDYQLQRRYRPNCRNRMEVRMCVNKVVSTFKDWSEWGGCTSNKQHRSLKCTNVVETKECGTVAPNCGNWTEWTPALKDGTCETDRVYRRHRQNCPEIEVVAVCGSVRCTGCSKDADCDGLTGECKCKKDFTGDGKTCTPVDPCTKHQCGPHASCVPDGKQAKCVCSAGFTGKAGAAGTPQDPCVDLDECATGTHQCPRHSDCNNTEGDYTCKCQAGFVKRQQPSFMELSVREHLAVRVEKNPHGVCEDINECSESGGGNLCPGAADCVNTEGSYECRCRDGYVRDSKTQSCVDVDECVVGGACSPNAICTNTVGSFKCECPSGYRGSGTTEDPCHKIDYCLENLHDCAGPAGHSKCVNEEIGFRCVCDDGYKGVGKRGAPCVDINECDKSAPRHNCDSNATCTNTDGSFTCKCNAGFSGSGSGENSCTDIDECQTGDHNCAPEATCTNTKGSFTCACPDEGYTGDGTKCIDINECEKEGACHASASCTNTKGSFKCECLPGFRGDGHNCADIDECADGSHNCGNHAQCDNTPGLFTCKCDEGYTLPARAGRSFLEQHASVGGGDMSETGVQSFVEQTSLAEVAALAETQNCVDINECETKKDSLPDHSVCTNTDGSYEWSCRPGYERKEQICQKINFCAQKECSPEATCREINDGTDFECNCLPGYKGNGRGADGCIDMNECVEERVCAPEDAGGVCTNMPGSYACSCKKGYRKVSNDQCEDIDECALLSGTHAGAKEDIKPCDPNGVCTNIAGSYECRCSPGYSGDGFTCSDIDECADKTHTCGSHSKCVNTAGAFTCVCDEGFKPSSDTPLPEGRAPTSFSCKDINECTEGENECSPHATCQNTEGSYQCTCKPGFEGTGKECSNIEFCSAGRNDCDKNADCDENAAGTDYVCSCRKGYKGSGHTSRGAKDGCVDIDECQEAHAKGKRLCPDPGGVCENTDGSYQCTCSKGFNLVTEAGGAVGCQDIDECGDAKNNDCAESTQGGDCRNTVGSYTCSCVEGYTASADGKQCTDIDECASPGACSEHAKCINVKGGYTCECDAGYRLQAGSTRVCEDVDECKENVALVPPHSVCVNTAGGYNFTCQAGYERKQSANAHVEAPPAQGATIAGKNEGDGYTCEKIDFCGRGDCNPHAACTENAEGTEAICSCPKGYSTHNAGKGPDGCQDIDECAQNRCDVHGAEGVLCTNTDGSYECKCKDGYTMKQPHELVEEKNREIQNRALKQSKQEEEDAGGSFLEVSTARGYGAAFLQLLEELAALAENDQPRCVDIDECADSSLNECAPEGGKCVNLPGGYECSCLDGYAQNDDKCTDIDECEEADACVEHATCTNLPGSFKCTCNEGYELIDNECRDIDECSAPGGNECDTHRAKCINTSGSYNCECLPGFDGDGRACNNIDECKLGTHSCPANARCTDTTGSYDCNCEAGYEADGEDANGDPTSCVDRDECNTANPCPENSTCANTPGAFTCTCNDGFRPSGEAVEESGVPVACDPVDFCEGRTCSVHATCKSASMTAVCECNSGFEGDGEVCTDIDECKGTHDCDSHAACVNTKGSYACACRSGYEGDGYTCTDVDECATGKAVCDPNAVCENIPGSFLCKCSPGYKGSGFRCTPEEVQPGQIKCLEWSPWSDCRHGKRERFCLQLPSKKERVCCKGATSPLPKPPTTLPGEEQVTPELQLPEPESGGGGAGGAAGGAGGGAAGGAGGGAAGGAGGGAEEEGAGPEAGGGAGGGGGVGEGAGGAGEGEAAGGEGGGAGAEGGGGGAGAGEGAGEGGVGGGAGGAGGGEGAGGAGGGEGAGGAGGGEGAGGAGGGEGAGGAGGGEGAGGAGGEGAGGAGPGVGGGEHGGVAGGGVHGGVAGGGAGGLTPEETLELELEALCGPWGEWTDCPGEANNMTVKKREKTDSDSSCKDEILMMECPDLELEKMCGNWGPYSACGMPLEGLQFATREHCPGEVMYAKCESTTPPPPSPDGRCTAWAPWGGCTRVTIPGGTEEEGEEAAMTVLQQKRKCMNADLEESRLCVEEEGTGETPVPESCGEMTGWGPCQNKVQTRHLENCPDVVETRQCITAACAPFGEWTECGATAPGRRLRMRENCDLSSGCDCVETELCEGLVTEEEAPEVLPEEVPPPEGLPPEELPPGELPPVTGEEEEEEKEEEGGTPTAAIAGGIVGGVLLLGAAGGGAAYMMKGGAPAVEGEAEQVVFEGEGDEGAGAEEPPESETVIEIEDDAWADT